MIKHEERGTLFGKSFDNRVTIFYDVAGDPVCGSREYLSDITPLLAGNN